MAKDSAYPDGYSHAKGLWALCWRMLVFGPLIAIFGAVLLTLVLGLTVLLPAYAVILGMGDKYGWAILCVTVWLLWLKFGGRVRHVVFEGFEHGSL